MIINQLYFIDYQSFMNINYSNMMGKVLTLLGDYNRFLPGFCEYIAIILWYIYERF